MATGILTLVAQGKMAVKLFLWGTVFIKILCFIPTLGVELFS
jgi:hypothetical protein